MFRHLSRLIAITFVLTVVTLIHAHKSQAVTLPPKIQAGQDELILNGWGTRARSFVQLYIAGLYLTQPNNRPAEIVAANAPMAIRINITSRFVTQQRLISSLSDGFYRSTRGNTTTIRNEINQFRRFFRDPIRTGDVFDIVYLPEHGVIVNKNGEYKGMISGMEFKQALFNIWLSENPVDGKLKRGMLTSRTTR